MPQTDHTLIDICSTLSILAKQAGEAIMAIYKTDFAHWEKADSSPLTEADLRADEIIQHGLRTAFPNEIIVSEESNNSTWETVSASYFLVDPLDGTKEFLKQNDEFTVNIALIENGFPVVGVMYAPALKTLYYASQGHGAWKQLDGGEPIQITAATPIHGQTEQDPLRIVGSRSHTSDAMATWLENCPNHSFVAAGSALKFGLIAEGKADIYPRLSPTMQWDTAAGQCIVEQAGGTVLDRQGQRFRYGLDRPLLNDIFYALAHSYWMPLTATESLAQTAP